MKFVNYLFVNGPKIAVLAGLNINIYIYMLKQTQQQDSI